MAAKLGLTILAATANVAVHRPLSTEEWQKQSIYSLVTDRFARTAESSAGCSYREYCGGTWKGIEEQLDYIQGMGFTAVWISPIVKQIGPDTALGAPYHGYWAQDLYALNENFGTEEDLISLSSALHDRGMYLMVDVVANHMASPGPFNATDWSSLRPFNSSSYFHSPCWPDYSSANKSSVYTCMSGDTDGKVTLADLKTETDVVRTMLGEWIRAAVDRYAIDGLRLDSAKHIEPTFWAPFLSAAAEGGMFGIAEYFDGDPKTYPAMLDNLPSAMNYPMFYWIQRSLGGATGGDLTELIKGMHTMSSTMKTSTLGMFTDNHDQLRFGAVSGDMARTRNAVAFAHLMDGIPIVYYGAEQHFSGGFEPSNRQPLWTSEYRTDAEMYQWFQKMNKIRSLVIESDPAFIPFQAAPIYPDSRMLNGSAVRTMALKKSDVVSVITNVGLGGARSNVSLEASSTQYTADTEYVDMVSCERFRTASNGRLAFEMGAEPRIFFPASRMDDAQHTPRGICGGRPVDSKKPSCLVAFNVTVETEYGERVEMLGDLAGLGNSDVHQAISLDSASYPVWTATVEVPPGEEARYQYLKINSEGDVSWDGGAKGAKLHSYTVPVSCTSSELVHTPAGVWSGGPAAASRARLVRRSW